MAKNKLKEIAAYKAKIAALEKEVVAERQQKLSGLHKEVGLESTEALIAALRSLGKSPRKSAAPRKGKRTRITPAIKQGVGKAVEAGKKGAEIARQFGISIPSIQNIKKELGLVKTRATKPAAKKAAKKAAKTVSKKAPKKAVKKAVKKPAKKAAKK